MKIAVTEANKKQLEAALDEVNGRAASFTVNQASVLYKVAEWGEKLLNDRGVLVKHRCGSTVTFKPHGPSAQSYSYTAKTTIVTLTRGSKEWYLTNVRSSVVYPRDKAHYGVAISEKAADDVARHAMRGIEIHGQREKEDEARSERIRANAETILEDVHRVT